MGNTSKIIFLLLGTIFILSIGFGCGNSNIQVVENSYDGRIQTLRVIMPDDQEMVITGKDLRKTDENIIKNNYRVREITSLLGLREEMPLLIFTDQGKIVAAKTGGYLGIEQEDFFYLDTLSSGEKITGILGLMVNPPKYRITQVTEDTKKFLASGDRVLIIFLDGFGYLRYEISKREEIIPYISSLGELKKGVTVFPPITPVAYAAIVTGKTPAETGIKKRGDGPLKVPTIFHWAEEIGKKTLVLEGNQHFFDLPGEVIFHNDLDGDKLVDEEIFISTREKLREVGSDLVLVHFHSVDDVSHTYGPESEEAKEQIKIVDRYVGELLKIWRGQVIIVADHGQHGVNEAGRLGNHGDFIPLDMFIPIIMGEVE